MGAGSKHGLASDKEDDPFPITKRACGSRSRSLLNVVISSSDIDSDENDSAPSSSSLSDPPPTDEIGSWPGSDDLLSPESPSIPSSENPPVPSDSDLDEAEAAAIATSELTKIIQFDGAKAWLDMRIMIQKDHDDTLSCRLGYTTHIFLTYTDARGETQSEFAGFINAWRISKPTLTTRQGGNEMAWVDELLTEYEQEGSFTDHSETTLCMQALFDQFGNPRGRANRELHGSLRDDSLLFLEMVYLRPKFQAKGLIGHIFPMWHALLNDGGLPEWYSFSGQIVLMPSRPEDPYGAAWDGSSDRHVERVLTRVYGRYGYQTLWANQPVTVLQEDGLTENTYAIRVMCRSVP